MYKSKLKGFSLVELILAIGIFTMAISSFAFLGIESYRTLRTSQSRIISSEQSRQIADLIILVKNQSWGNIVDHTNDGDKYILNTGGFLNIENGQGAGDGFTYFFTIGMAHRDGNGNLVEEGLGVEDHFTRVVNLTVLFENTLFGVNEFNTDIYINSWNILKFSQETKEDFDQGTNEGTDITVGGEIVLEKSLIFDGPADWCKPELTRSVLTLDPRSQKLMTYLDNVYITRGESSSDPLLSHIRVTPPLERDDVPELTRIGFFTPSQGSNKATDLYYYDGYIYTANPREAKDSVWIIDMGKTASPLINYSPEVGWYSMQGRSVDATTIHAYGNYGFVGYNNRIDIFDISSKTGARSRIGNPITIGSATAKVKEIVVKNNHIFVAMTDHTSPLVIIDITDVNSPQIVSNLTGTTNTKGNALFVSENTNRTYLGTYPEFFVVDTTNKSAPSVIGSFNTGGMDILSIGVIEEENRAILGGTGSSKYIVLKLDNLESMDKCGELEAGLILGNVLDLDVVTYEDRLFTYILTREGNNNELQIIEGGPGEGGSGQGDDYIHSGEYISSIFEMFPDTRLYGLNLYGLEPEGTSLKVQLKLGDEPNLSTSSWFGPDGTVNTYFLLGENVINLPSKQGRYLQYKVNMTSNDPEKSPVLDKIEVIYE